MEIELLDNEADWLSIFDNHIHKLPKGLELIINSDSSAGNVEVMTSHEGLFTASHKRWINKLKKIISEIPQTSEFWIISNIDGLHVGKGYPSVISTSSYSVGGACSSYSDNFHLYFHSTHNVLYGEVDSSRYDSFDYEEIKTNVGDFRYWMITETSKQLL